MNRYFFSLFFFVTLLLGACSKQDAFEIKGQLDQNTNSKLYLYELLETPKLIDSVEIKDGNFVLQYRASGEPRLYRITTPQGSLFFAADSATRLSYQKATEEASFMPMQLVEGDPDNKLIFALQLRTKRFEQEVQKATTKEQVEQLHSDYAQYLMQEVIFANPRSMAALTALLQAPLGIPFFRPELGNVKDRQAYGAVATAFDTYRPTSPYTELLRKRTLEAMAINRAQREKIEKMSSLIEGAQLVDYPEISLYDNHGNEQKLSQLVKEHKRVLLGFVAMGAEDNPRLMALLRGWYKQEKPKGAEIFLISLDPDKQLWLQASASLPWVNAWDPYGKVAALYGVQSLPIFFSVSEEGVQRIKL